MRYLRIVRRLLVVLVIVGLVALNVATLTVASVFGALTGLVDALDVPSVRSTAQARADHLDRERRQAVAERDAARRSARVQKANLRRTQARLSASAARERALDARLAGTTARLEGLRRTIGTQVNRASRSIAGRTVRRVSRSIATLPGRAIPYVGIATTVAFAAWDVSEACAALMEMSEMRAALELEPDPERSVATVCGQKVPGIDELERMLGAAPDEGVAECRRMAGPFDIEARDACETLRGVETVRTAAGGREIRVGPACIGPACDQPTAPAQPAPAAAPLGPN